MGTQTQKRIAELKAEIAKVEASEIVEDFDMNFQAYRKNQNDQKVQDAFYSVCKKFTNRIEKARKLTAV